jgi:hypothetical protein
MQNERNKKKNSDVKMNVLEKSGQTTKRKKSGNIFDRYLRQVFSLVENFKDFMKSYADSRVYAAIDWSRVEAFPTHSFDLNNKELIADLIFTCGVRGVPDGKVGTVVLFEIVGKNIFYLPKRFLQYLT